MRAERKVESGNEARRVGLGNEDDGPMVGGENQYLNGENEDAALVSLFRRNDSEEVTLAKGRFAYLARFCKENRR